ncbi:MAG: response regulator [Nitrospira sp.]
MVQVLLVDDHTLIRQGLRAVLAPYEDLHVVAEAKDGVEAVAFVGCFHPRVVVMDINMPRMNGIEATTHIKARWPGTTVIGISVNTGDGNSDAMKRAGAATVLPKDTVVDQLHDVIIQEVGGPADEAALLR